MRKLLVAVLAVSLSQPALARETVTVRQLGEAVHYLIELYQRQSKEIEELKKENEKLKKEVSDLKKKFVLLKMEQNLIREQQEARTSSFQTSAPEKEMTVPVVEVVPGSTPNPYPWITFKRRDVECSLPERNSRGYIYYNILVTKSREKAVNIARNVARAGICSVVRRITKPEEKPALYRVVVIPDREGLWKKKLQQLGLKWVPYVRDLDLTRSSGGKL